MTLMSQTFEPGMLSEARRPFYDAFIKKTGEIAANFVSTNPKPSGIGAKTIMDRINGIDNGLGQGLLTRDPENLAVRVFLVLKSGHPVSDLIDHEPVTKGLIKGEVKKQLGDGTLIFETDFKDLFIVVKEETELVGTGTGASHEKVLNSTLVGSNIIGLKN